MTVEARSTGGTATAEERARLAETVAWASRILALCGYEDLTLGHVSARGADDHTVYIKRKGVALGEVTPEDIVVVDLDADYDRVPEGMHLETVLHTEVYKRRPDVRSVVHGHPPHATALGATDAEFHYLTHDSVLFVGGISVYDGVPDLILNARQGADVARALGDGTALLLRNHGVLVAERDVQWAVLASVLLERAVYLQTIAGALGPLHPIPQELLPGIHAVKYQADFPGEYWDAWVRELRRSGRAFGMPGALMARAPVGELDIELTVNGEPVRATIEPAELLLDFLRERLGLTGAKRSCDAQVCGTCTVLVDGGPVSACTYLAADAGGRAVLTVEGFAETAEFAEFETAFVRHAALQCGYCTPGLLLTIKSLRDAGELGNDEEIRHGLDGNICRCTGYRSILAAARELAGLRG